MSLNVVTSKMFQKFGHFLPLHLVAGVSQPTKQVETLTKSQYPSVGEFTPRQASKSTVGRIAIYVDSLQGYGADKVLVKIANGLVDENVSVDFVLAKPSHHAHQSLIDDVNIFNLSSNRFNIIKNVLGLATYLRRYQPDILFSSIYFNNVVCACALMLAGTKTKLVVRQANTLERQFKDFPVVFRQVLHLLTHLAYKRADLVVCQCRSMVPDLVDFMKVDPKKVRVIYNPTVTADIYDRAQVDPEHRWLNLDRTEPVILAIGRFKPQKDFVTLIQAFALVKKRFKNAKLILLGDGPQRKYLEGLANQLGVRKDVDFAGFQANPYAFISMADLFVSSSRYEGLPNVLIEALALGKRIVATSCPGGSSEILRYGKYGALVPIKEPSLLAEAIEDQLACPRACLREPEAVAGFEQKSQVKVYIETFLSILESNYIAWESTTAVEIE